jgi:hypothetical protein
LNMLIILLKNESPPVERYFRIQLRVIYNPFLY